MERSGWIGVVGVVAVVVACGSSGGPTGPGPGPVGGGGGGAGLRVLFVGNSLTYVNDLPAIVAGIAEAAGEDRPLAYRTVAFPGVALSDHWAAGTALDVIGSQEWDVVVLQQGPSSLPESREHLVEWATRFAEPIREAGAVPALYMVWPEASRPGAFDAVRESYRAAAEAVNGLFLPAGEGWRAAWRVDPDLALYSADGLHPTLLGSVIAALVVYQGLYGRSPVGLPAEIPRRGIDPIRIDPALARLAQEAAAEATAAWGRPAGDAATRPAKAPAGADPSARP